MGHEKGGRLCGEKSDEDVCGGEEKELKTEAKEDGQWGKEMQNWAVWRQMVRNINTVGKYTV